MLGNQCVYLEFDRRYFPHQGQGAGFGASYTTDCFVPNDRHMGRGRRFALVRYSIQEEANRAVRIMIVMENPGEGV